MYLQWKGERHLPPHSITPTIWLALKDLGRIIAVETEEIRQLGRSVNLSLPDVLTLTQHRCSNQVKPVLARDQLSSLEENRGSVNKGSFFPIFLCLQCRFNGGVGLLLGGKWVVRENRVMLRWKRLVPGLCAFLNLAIVEDITANGELGPKVCEGFF